VTLLLFLVSGNKKVLFIDIRACFAIRFGVDKYIFNKLFNTSF